MSRALAVVAGVGVVGVGLSGLAWAASRVPPTPVLPVRPTLREEERHTGGLHLLHRDRIEQTAGRLARSVLGQPYSWGGGRHDRGWPQGWPGVHGGKGWDCGGLSLAWSALLLRYPWEGPDRGARDIDQLCTPVPLGQQRVGDLAAYRGRHVTAVVSAPDPSTGHSVVLSASGGTSRTNGDDPTATVKLQASGDYRGDFLRYLRLPPVDVSDAQAVTCMAVHRLLAGEALPNDPRLPRPQLRAELARRYAGLPAVADWLARTPAPQRSASVSGVGLARNARATQRRRRRTA